MGDTFDGLIQCLEDHFCPSKKEELFKTLLWNRFQKPDEDFPELAYNIRRMVKNAYHQSGYKTVSEMSRDHFTRALRDPIYFKEPENLDEAVCVAIKLAARENRFEQKPTMYSIKSESDSETSMNDFSFISVKFISAQFQDTDTCKANLAKYKKLSDTKELEAFVCICKDIFAYKSESVGSTRINI